MALLKSIEKSNTGQSNEYWVLETYAPLKSVKTVRATLAGYANQAVRNTPNSQPGDFRDFLLEEKWFTGNLLDVTPADVFAAIKLRDQDNGQPSEFADAVDC